MGWKVGVRTRVSVSKVSGKENVVYETTWLDMALRVAFPFTCPFVLATMRRMAVPTSRFMLLKSSSTGAGLVLSLTGAMFTARVRVFFREGVGFYERGDEDVAPCSSLYRITGNVSNSKETARACGNEAARRV